MCGGRGRGGGGAGKIPADGKFLAGKKMEREGEGSCCRLQETSGNQNNAAFRSCLISAQISPECGAKLSLNTATPQQQGCKELQQQKSHQCEKASIKAGGLCGRENSGMEFMEVWQAIEIQTETKIHVQPRTMK